VRRAYRRFGNLFMEDCARADLGYYCPDDQPWTLDEDVLLDARRRVASKLLFLTHPDRYPDPEAPPETPGGGGCGTGPGSGLHLAWLAGLLLLTRRRRR
jgi:MYXO-CTERM domain-containing protein